MNLPWLRVGVMIVSFNTRVQFRVARLARVSRIKARTFHGLQRLLRTQGMDLKPRGALFGWYLAHFRDDSVVYQRGEVHFAAVHPTELALYNWRTKRDTLLFPRQPFQAIRLAHIQELREFICASMNSRSRNPQPGMSPCALPCGTGPADNRPEW